MCDCGTGFHRTCSSTVCKRCTCNFAWSSNHQRNSRRRNTKVFDLADVVYIVANEGDTKTRK